MIQRFHRLETLFVAQLYLSRFAPCALLQLLQMRQQLILLLLLRASIPPHLLSG
jgi:hypothetical protein